MIFPILTGLFVKKNIRYLLEKDIISMIYEILLTCAIFTYLLVIILSVIPYRFPDGKLRKFPKVSAIVVSHNEEKVIETTLRKLKDSDYPNLEIILVDSSNDNTRNIARKYVNKIIKDPGIGKAYALNLGVEKSTGDILYFLDADTIVEKTTIRKLISSLDGYKVCTGMVLPLNKSTLLSRLGCLQLSTFNFGAVISKRLVNSTMLIGKNFVIFKKTLLSIGKFQGYLSEDMNLSSRLYFQDIKVNFTNALCYEQVPERLNDLLKQQERWYFGGFSAINDSLGTSKVNLKAFLLLPVLSITMFTPALSILFLVSFILTNNFLSISALILAFLTYFISIRFLDLDDVLFFPLTFAIYSIIQVYILVLVGVKNLFGIKIKWARTEKNKISFIK